MTDKLLDTYSYRTYTYSYQRQHLIPKDDRCYMKDAGQKTRRLVGIFLLGIVLSNYPVLSLFNLDRLALGIPLIYLYMFSSWAVIIFLIFLVIQPWVVKENQTNKPSPEDR